MKSTKLNPPNAHKTGSKPINGIFATKEVNILTGGYTDFYDCVQGAKRCDHWCLWIDILLSDVFGSKIPPIPKFAGQRVNNKNPCTAHKFNKIYKEYIYAHNLHQEIFDSEKRAIFPLPTKLKREADQIASMRNKGIRIADAKCRRIFKGTVPFTPKFNKLNNRRLFWDHIYAKKLNKRKIGTEVIRRFAK